MGGLILLNIILTCVAIVYAIYARKCTKREHQDVIDTLKFMHDFIKSNVGEISESVSFGLYMQHYELIAVNHKLKEMLEEETNNENYDNCKKLVKAIKYINEFQKKYNNE